MINPSSNVFKVCLIVGRLHTKRCCRSDPFSSVIQADDISSDILFCFLCLDGDNPSYIGPGVVHLCLMPYGPTIVVFQCAKSDYFHIQQVVLMLQIPGCSFI